MKKLDIPALTGARFVAAAMVFLSHASPVLQFSDSTLLLNIFGPLSLGMTLFFTLSGFVIWINYAESFRSADINDALRRFAAARFARLYPMFAVTVALGVAVTPWPTLAAALPGALTYLTLLQAWAPANGGKIMTLSVWAIGHTWSISVEAFVYVCFPAMTFVVWRLGSRRALVIGAIASAALFGVWLAAAHAWTAAHQGETLLGLSADDAEWWLVYYSPLSHVMEFFCGCCAGNLFLSRPRSAPRGWTAVGAGLAIVASLALISTFARFGLPVGYVRLAGRMVPILGFAWLLYFVSIRRSLFERILSSPAAVAGGEISYSIYLLHPFVVAWFVAPTQSHLSLAGAAEWAALVAGAAVATAALSWTTYRLIERPARKRLRALLMTPGRRRQPQLLGS